MIVGRPSVIRFYFTYPLDYVRTAPDQIRKEVITDEPIASCERRAIP